MKTHCKVLPGLCRTQSVRSAYILRFVLLVIGALFCGSRLVWAQEVADPPVYEVRPGDTLPSLAGAWGTDVPTLMRLNDLQDPRQIYPGQLLLFPERETAKYPWMQYRVVIGDDWGQLARRTGSTWRVLAQANGVLNPSNLAVGQMLYIPPIASAQVISSVLPSRVLMAARYNLPYWQVVRLNPNAAYTGDSLLIAGVPAEPNLPFPLTSLDMTPQPHDRGTTAVLALTTEVPVFCEVRYFDYQEACYAQADGRHLFAFAPISPLQTPGRYTLDLRLWSEDGVSTTLALPFLVAAGQYDYERLDLPSDRQVLLDPQLSQDERVKVAALRVLRTSERYWEFPFQLPLEAAVTSYYGSRRSYGAGFSSYHAGSDLDAEVGAPVLAPASGMVVLAESLVVRGNAILIDHGWGVVTGYWHLSRIGVTPGQYVTQGERIGAVGGLLSSFKGFSPFLLTSGL